jgi:hypothetical protein
LKVGFIAGSLPAYGNHVSTNVNGRVGQHVMDSGRQENEGKRLFARLRIRFERTALRSPSAQAAITGTSFLPVSSTATLPATRELLFIESQLHQCFNIPKSIHMSVLQVAPCPLGSGISPWLWSTIVCSVFLRTSSCCTVQYLDFLYVGISCTVPYIYHTVHLPYHIRGTERTTRANIAK